MKRRSFIECAEQFRDKLALRKDLAQAPIAEQDFYYAAEIYSFHIITSQHFFHYTITARLWYNCPIRTEQIYDLRMCEDVLMYNKRFAFIIPQNQIFYNGKQYQICSFYALAS